MCAGGRASDRSPPTPPSSSSRRRRTGAHGPWPAGRRRPARPAKPTIAWSSGSAACPAADATKEVNPVLIYLHVISLVALDCPRRRFQSGGGRCMISQWPPPPPQLRTETGAALLLKGYIYTPLFAGDARPQTAQIKQSRWSRAHHEKPSRGSEIQSESNRTCRAKSLTASRM